MDISKFLYIYNNLTMKFLAERCPFFSTVMSWHRFLRLWCMSDFSGSSWSRTCNAYSAELS